MQKKTTSLGEKSVFLGLETHLQVFIMSFLQLEDLVKIGASCSVFQQVLDTNFTMAKICSSQKLLAFRCQLMTRRMRVLYGLIGFHPSLPALEEVLQGVKHLASSQLFFASRTIHTANNPYMSTTNFLPNFSFMASLLACSLCETTKVLTTVMTNKQLLDDLEILPMTLRRNYEQLRQTFFSTSIDNIHEPSRMIQDTLGRSFWETQFGNKNLVSYQEFENKLVGQWRAKLNDDEEEKLRVVLGFLLNFPNDGIVTTYKWDVLLSQWGSFPNLLDNLRYVALRPGFLGVMNGKQAEELLTSFPGNNILIRFSSSTKSLSIAYNIRTAIKHERKPPLVNLIQFLQNALLDKAMIPLSLQWDKIRHIKTLEDCVKTPVSSLFAITTPVCC
eukprot:TRINITY_DN14512_c0_g1_i1.p1 TRINITY_DN14512_c0_g1~~TRINITY_DN14512_c0_g1_i1.p1  ORF type:complete len:388 (-),score=38.12 TRINITY_DN14512_c0_g1_i1:156-1319(-)